MQGMGEAHRLAPAVVADRDQAVAFELLEHREAGGGLQLAEADRLAQRQQLEHGASRRVEPVRDEPRPPRGDGSARRAARRAATRRRAGRGAAAPAHRAPAPAAPGRSPGWPPTARPTPWRRAGPPARCAAACRRRAGRARRGRSASLARRATTGSPFRARLARRPPWRRRTAHGRASRRSIIVSDEPSSRWASSSNSTGAPDSPGDRREHSAGRVEQLGECDGVDRILVAERGQRAGPASGGRPRRTGRPPSSGRPSPAARAARRPRRRRGTRRRDGSCRPRAARRCRTPRSPDRRAPQ